MVVAALERPRRSGTPARAGDVTKIFASEVERRSRQCSGTWRQAASAAADRPRRQPVGAAAPRVLVPLARLARPARLAAALPLGIDAVRRDQLARLLGGGPRLRADGATLTLQRRMSAGFDRYRDSYADQVERAIAFARDRRRPLHRAEGRGPRRAPRVARFPTARKSPRARLRLRHRGTSTRWSGFTSAAVTGIDVSGGLVKVAARQNPDVEYTHYDGRAIPYPDGSFDLAFASCVFHHIEADQRAVAGEGAGARTPAWGRRGDLRAQPPQSADAPRRLALRVRRGCPTAPRAGARRLLRLAG